MGRKSIDYKFYEAVTNTIDKGYIIMRDGEATVTPLELRALFDRAYVMGRLDMGEELIKGLNE